MTLVTEVAFSAPFLQGGCMKFQGGIHNPVLVYRLQRHDSIWPPKSKTDWLTQGFLAQRLLMIFFDCSTVALVFQCP